MANLVLASKRELKSGMFWHVYRSENNNKSEEFYFANPLKALRYAFILRKRFNTIIPKGVYGKLMADVKASKSESAPAQAESTAQGTAGESENTAPVESKSKAKKAHRQESADREHRKHREQVNRLFNEVGRGSPPHKETLTTMVQVANLEWKDGSLLPECSLTHLGIETSHEVIAVNEDNGYHNTVVLQYHLHNGWEYANGVDLKAVFKDVVILQWSYIPRPVQRWQESFNE